MITPAFHTPFHTFHMPFHTRKRFESPRQAHPSFAAEFGDAFIGGTIFEQGSLHVSLECFLLTLRRMQSEDGVVATLSHDVREALNSVTATLEETCNLSLRLNRTSGGNAATFYLRPLVERVEGLLPAEVLVLPLPIGGVSKLLVVRRLPSPNDDACDVTVLCCGPSGLRYHTCVAEPPKFRYRTALELKGVGFDRVCDEALWVGLWYAMRTGGSTMLDGDGVLHHVRGPTPSPPERAAHT